MTRNIRKIVSIICAVALLLSLCAVSFIGSSSALHLDAVESDNSSLVLGEGTKVLDLTFEGTTNNGGVAMQSYSTEVYIENGVLYHGNADGAAGGMWLAKDNTVNSGEGKITIAQKINCTTANTEKANLFAIKPSTTYRISFKYAFRKDTTVNKAIEFMAATDPYLASNSGRGNSLNGAIASIIDPADTKVTTEPTAGDTSYYDWKEEVFVFTTKGDLGGHNYLGMRTSSSAGHKAYVKYDYITIEEIVAERVVDKTEVFDWTTDGATPSYWNPNNSNYLTDSDKTDNDITKGSYIDAEGLHYSFTKNSSPAYAKSWLQKASVRKNNDSTKLVFEEGNNYIITMKYKPVLVAANTAGWVGIGYGQEGSTIGALKTETFTEVANEWQYMTVIVNGSDIKGEILHVVGGTSTGSRCGVLVESLTVRTVSGAIVMYETAYGEIDKELEVLPAGSTIPTLPIPTNIPEGKGFAGWVCGDEVVDDAWVVPAGVSTITAKFSNTISKVTLDNQGAQTEVNLAVGLEIPAPQRPNVYLFFEGWYTDPSFTTEVTVVPDYDVTLYAKYNGTFLNFNNIAATAGTGTPGLVKDPADADNQVVKFTAGPNARPNFMIPAYDVAGSKAFELKPSTSYIVNFKIKMIDNDTAAAVDLYQGDQPSGDTSTRTSITGTHAAAFSTDEWTNVSMSFTTGETLYLERVKWSYQNHLFFTIYASKTNVGVYLDDFCIAEVLDKAPEGTVSVDFETNGPEIPSIYGYTGETIPALSAPTMGGYEFVGWYSDKRLTVPYNFEGATFSDKDIELYAKWEAVPFVVDFSDYQNGGGNASARAKFVNENGNDYVDWWVKHADTNTADTSTPYRIFLNKGGVHQTAELGATYSITFKYKLLEGNITIKMVTNGKLNGWSMYKVQPQDLGLNKVTDDWTTATLVTPITEIDGTGNYLSFGVAGHGHILIDDISVQGAGSVNLYGSTAIYFDTNGGDPVNAIGGDPGEEIGKLPTATKKGYTFNTWFTDKELTTPFTGKTFGEENITLYAGWMLGKFSESFEDFPNSVLAQGISGGYKLYKESSTGYDKANVQNGTTSIFRDGTQTGTKAFTLSRSADLELTVGKQYTLTFYVKPEAIVDAAGTISLIGMSANTGIAAPKSTNVIKTVGELKAGEWQKVSYTFTADNKYVGISTTAGNNMYLDNFTLTLKGYTGTTTGDTSVNPMIIAMMVILAAGALVVTGKKVFEK